MEAMFCKTLKWYLKLMHFDNVVNDVFYQYAKSQNEFVYWATKNKKSQILEVWKFAMFTTTDPYICHFCVDQNIEYFELIFLHADKIYHCLHLGIFFVDLSENLKCRCTREPKDHSVGNHEIHNQYRSAVSVSAY